MNRGEEGGVTHEGFVVVDAAFRRVKVKSIDYIASHHISTMKTINKRECLSLLLNNRAALDEIGARHPRLVPVIRYYDYRLEELLYQAEVMGELSRRLYEEYSFDRKAVAAVIAKHRLSFIGFLAIQRNKGGRDILLEIPIERWMDQIPDYAEEDIVASLMPNVPKK